MKIKHKKDKIIFPRLFFLILSISLILFSNIIQPNSVFGKNVVCILGVIGMTWMLLYFLGLIILFKKDCPALIIKEDYFIDNIKYQSFGKIPLQQITSIKNKKFSYGKRCLEISLSKEFSSSIQLNILQKILLWFDNYGDKSKIILSTIFIDCTFDELDESFKQFYKKPIER